MLAARRRVRALGHAAGARSPTPRRQPAQPVGPPACGPACQRARSAFAPPPAALSAATPAKQPCPAAAEGVAHEIEKLGGEALVVGANMGKVGWAAQLAARGGAEDDSLPTVQHPYAVTKRPQACCSRRRRRAVPRPPPSAAAALHPTPACVCAAPLPVQRDEIEGLFKAVTDKWGTVNVLVNNAVRLRLIFYFYLLLPMPRHSPAGAPLALPLALRPRPAILPCPFLPPAAATTTPRASRAAR